MSKSGAAEGRESGSSFRLHPSAFPIMQGLGHSITINLTTVSTFVENRGGDCGWFVILSASNLVPPHPAWSRLAKSSPAGPPPVQTRNMGGAFGDMGNTLLMACEVQGRFALVVKPSVAIYPARRTAKITRRIKSCSPRPSRERG